MRSRLHSPPDLAFARRAHERGAALILVTFLLVVLLVGGLALVGVTNGELSGARGSRHRAVTDACADAALEKVRALMPSIDVTAFSGSGGEMSVGGVTLEYKPGHFDSDLATAVVTVDPTKFDVSALYAGENITNVMGTAASSSTPDPGQMQVLTTTVVCSGSGYGTREMQLVFRYGTSMGAR